MAVLQEGLARRPFYLPVGLVGCQTQTQKLQCSTYIPCLTAEKGEPPFSGAGRQEGVGMEEEFIFPEVDLRLQIAAVSLN